MDTDEIAEAILVAHQRRDAASCLCGWAELGKSHAGHQVVMLREAVLLLPRAANLGQPEAASQPATGGQG